MSLSLDPDKLEFPFYHLIGGERVDAAGVLGILRPSDGQYCGVYPLAHEDLRQ
jgi:aldehyde dehydrogenase (NAD+)